MPQRPLPPVAEIRPLARSAHGVDWVDDYAWLRADNWQEVMRRPEALAADIRACLDAENAWCDAHFAPVTAFRDALFEELKGRLKHDESSVPMADGPFAYGTRYVTGGQHPLITRTDRTGGGEVTLIDGNREAEGKAYFRLAGATHAPDHSRLAFGVDDNGSEYFTLKIRDCATLTDAPEVIGETTGGAVWAADSRTLFYVRVDDNHRPSRVFRHVLGTPADQDVLIYEESDAGYFVGLGKTQSGRFIVIDVHDHETSEVHVIPADAPATPPRRIAARRTGVEYALEHHGERFIILTNDAGAEDFKLVTCPVDAPDPAGWTDLVPHAAGTLILSHAVYADHLVRLERTGGLPRIIVRRLSSGEEHAIAFDEEAYSLGLAGAFEFDTTTIRFTYSSMTTPQRVFDYDMASRARTLRKEQEIPSGHDPARYVTRRIFATADDGETVPVSLLYLKETPLDGTAPALIYGYGAYGHAMAAGFSTTALSLVNRGFVYAIAHIRGGKDKGYRWYAHGRREHKVNSFTDFIAATRALASQNFAAPDRIIAQGGSAGGMLMGAIANLAPELYAGIIAEVPFVDVLTTMLDDTLPLTPPEWPEWGNPITDATAFARIKAYSPYDNVAARPYPAMMVLAGLTDPRVTYWEPAKWVARLRRLTTGTAPILFKTNMDAGHGGASGRFDRLKEVALVQTFALQAAGISTSVTKLS